MENTENTENSQNSQDTDIIDTTDADLTEAFDRIAAIDPEDHRIEAGMADEAIDVTGLAGKIPLNRQGKIKSIYSVDNGNDENEKSEEAGGGSDDEKGVEEAPDGHFTYKYMLTQAYDKLGDHAKQKLKVRPPTVSIQGSKHCVLENFMGICQDINRDSDHIMKFILAELGTTASINAEGGMVVSGRFKQGAFEKLIRNYIKQFVLCPNCRSSNTKVTKRGRLSFIDCSHCTSSVVIREIESGYVAKTKANKKTMLNK